MIAIFALSALTGHAAFAAVNDGPVPNTMASRVAACSACHSERGETRADGYYPRLAGKPAGYLWQQLRQFRDGQRHYGLMQQLVAPLPDAYLWDIAQHFSQAPASYPPPSVGGDSAASLQRGQTLVLKGDAALQRPACVQCHGQSLMGVAPFTPGLLGLPRDYLNSQLGAFRTGERRGVAPDCMAHVAQQLSPSDVVSVSAWLASQPVPPGAKPEVAPINRPANIRCGIWDVRLPAGAAVGAKP